MCDEDKLLADNVGYIIKRVRAYSFTPPLNTDCCINYVLEEMTKRIRKFDETKSSIHTFIYNNVKKLVYSYYKSHNIKVNRPIKQGCSAIWNEPVTNQTSNESTTLEEDFWIDKRDYAIACEINELKTYNRNILLLYFYDGLSEIEIARLLGVSQPTISNHLHKALDTIKPKINKRLTELDEIRSEL